MWNAMVTLGTEVILFGGWSSAHTSGLADTWVYSGTIWSSLALATAPPARWGHGMATLP
jgi:hypothetical protein